MEFLRSPSHDQMRHPERNRYVRLLARLGFLSKGAVYGLVGVLALMAAWGRGGKPTDGEGTLKFMGNGPFGEVLLVLVGVGLSGYALWRFIEALWDPCRVGTDGKGILKRIAYAASAVANVALAITAFQLAFLGRSHSSKKTWISDLMAMPLGPWLVGAVGIAVGLAAFSQFHKAYTVRFMNELLTNEMSAQERSWTEKLGKLGLYARGVVFLIIGVAITRAAINHSPGQAKGVAEALRDVGTSKSGPMLLTLVALGLVAYAVYMLSCMRYRKLVH